MQLLFIHRCIISWLFDLKRILHCIYRIYCFQFERPYALDIEHKLDVTKTFRRCPGLPLDSLCTFNFCLVLKGYTKGETNHNPKPLQLKLKRCNKLHSSYFAKKV